MSPVRVLAVARSDARARMRRPVLAFLLVAVPLLVYVAIPDPRTGRGILEIEKARALYTSPALAFATAGLLPFLLALFGFYLVNGALENDRLTGMGLVAGSTPVSDAEYLLGKLLGNITLLAAVTFGFMTSAMAMHLVRGEGPLQPLVYLAHYAVLVGPSLVSVAALALFFECVPALSGRGGDVLYFFVLTGAIPLSVEPWRAPGTTGISPGAFFDFSGLAFVMREVARSAGTTHFSLHLGSSEVTRATTTFPGLSFTLDSLAVRAASLALPALLFGASVVAFRRFDPSRERAKRSSPKQGPIAFLNSLARPVTSRLLALAGRPGREHPERAPGFGRFLTADATLTLRLQPVLVPTALAGAVLSFSLKTDGVMRVLLPVLFALLAATLSEVSTRDEAAGVSNVVFAAPRVRARFALWKLASATVVALVLTGPPALRLAFSRPAAALSVLLGTLVAASLAVLLGLATGTPKTFLVLYLAFWYVVLNDGGHAPALDFAGWYGLATPGVQAAYFAALILMAAAASAVQAAKNRRHSG